MTADKTLIEKLLDEQRSLTAVARFAQKHEQAQLPLQSRFYRDLIPSHQPGSGQQYSFEVDLDKCSGCKACVAACHSLNGLEPEESWRSVGLLVAPDSAQPFQQTVTTACHHCLDPGCLHGCPVLAYEKDPLTGIVRHLDDQCIGCSYCVLKCPYEVPRYSERLGIVRKCDMCRNRLEAGEAPACVQSCPNEAIRITVINHSDIRAGNSSSQTTNSFLPGSPDPAWTLPSTRYLSARPLPPTLKAANHEQLSPAPAHWPLVWMLVLTQFAAGGLASAATLQFFADTSPARLIFASAAAGFVGLACSVFHLGRPLKAWRAFLGVRRSWLSREIMSFNASALSVLLLLASEVLPVLSSLQPALLLASAALSLLAVACSAMVYHDTPREFWTASRTGPRFAGTTLLAAAALPLLFFPSHWPRLIPVLALVTLAKFIHESAIIRHLGKPSLTPLKRSALLMVQHLRTATLARFGLLLLGGIALPWLLPVSTPSAVLIIGCLFMAELAERYLFFAAVAQPIMPGGPAA